MKHVRTTALVIAAAAIAAGCAHRASNDDLTGTWTNAHRSAKQPAIVSMEFVGAHTVTIAAIDTLAAAGWHPPTTATEHYRIIAPGKLEIDAQLGSVVLDYQIEDGRLVLSGHGLAQVLGKDEPPQTLDHSG
jgi:hypothetical protein